MIIIGAGMAGLLAGHMFRQYEPNIMEAQSTLPHNHSALLRFRSEAVGRECGIKFRKVKVRKSIMANNTFIDLPNIHLCNLYSYKVLGEVQDRSIWNLDPVDRYIAPTDFVKKMATGLKITYNKPLTNIGQLAKAGKSGPVISTIPMPTMMKIVDWKHQPHFGFRKIWTYRAEIEKPRIDVCQTIYYPELDTMYYRSSIVDNTLIIEFIMEPDEESLEKSVRDVLVDYGISDFAVVQNGCLNMQKYGKIMPIDNDLRQEFIYTMTREYNVYSLGRFATWRQLLLDDVVEDARVIEKLVGVETNRRAYLQSLVSVRQ